MANFKLFDRKRIVILLASVVVGALYYLGYKYYSTGVITSINIMGAVIALFMGVIIILLVVRYANREN